VYAVIFVFNPEEFDVVTIEEQLRGIRAKDITFKYVIKELKDGKYMLKVYAKDIDQAHKRGLWLRDKLFNGKIGYKVR